jgi:hypothetical protein
LLFHAQREFLSEPSGYFAKMGANRGTDIKRRQHKAPRAGAFAFQHLVGCGCSSVRTRKLIVSNGPLVMNVMQGFVETIHLFKTRPDIVVPLIQRYVKIDDRKVAEDL